MMGGSETGSGDKDVVHAVAIHVPIGWQRRVAHGQVVYVSPSGTALSTLDEVKTYLLTDGTCKCGLECPLVINKVFNFSVGVKAEQQQHSQQLGKAEQDMTKLCNHRRKVVAMAALCRSMQSSQLPFSAHHHSEVNSVLVDNQDPKRMRVEKEEDHGTYQPRPHVARGRPHNNVNPAPCASPRSSPQLMYPYNGSSPLAHTATNSHHHPMDALRRLQYPLPPLSASSSSSSSFSTVSSNSPFPGYSDPRRPPRTPTPQNLSQGQRSIPQTPETPGSPRLGPLSPPPPSSPMTMAVGGGRGMQSHASHHHHSVIVGGSPLSPSPSPSPSVNNMNCASPHQRSRHPSSSSSSLSDQGGVAAGGVEGRRRKSTSSSPHSPLPCSSPNASLYFPKFKLEDILEQFKNSGNSSTNNHHILFPSSPVLLANQSSSNNPHVLSLALDKGGNLKPSKAALGPVPNAGPAGFGPNAAGPSGLPLGPFLNHQHSHQARQPHPSSFPASSLLSAAAKAQLASQMTQSSNPGGNPLTSASPLDVLKDNQQQQSSKGNPDPGVDTLIPLPLQGKDNPILQQLLPALLNPAVLGDLSGLSMASLHNMVGLGAGPLLLPPVQASALGMSLLQGPDGAINLLNNIQLNIAPPTENKPMPVQQETQSPAPQEDNPASHHLVPETVPSPAPAPPHPPAPPPHHPTSLLQRGSEGGGSASSSGGIIDPYTSFMDTIYTSFLQVSAKEREEGAQSGPTDPTSPFCALPPVSFHTEHHPSPSTHHPLPTLPHQASAPISLSPRRACSLRNPDLSRLSLEAVAHSPAQGTPKPSEHHHESASPRSQRKTSVMMVDGHSHHHPEPHPPLPPIYLEEAKTDCAGGPAAAACPYIEGHGVERQGDLPQGGGGYHSPRDGGGGGRSKEESAGVLLHTEQGRDQAGPTVGARRGRKRKQTLQNVLEDFRDMDAAALEDNKPTAALLKPERSVRGRRRRGARSQRQ